MATVVFSASLQESIITKATRHFTEAKNEAVGTLRDDRELYMALLRIHTSAAMVEQLWKIYDADPAFFNGTWGRYDLDIHGTNFVIDSLSRPTSLDRSIYTVPSNIHPVYDRAKEILKPWFRAHTDAQNLTNALNKLFENTKTLNRAEQIMPNILDWCDEETISRLRRRAERTGKDTRTPEEILRESFNDDAMAATARARVMQK